jgi:uncharacterized protein CbrC (UPF0167 family)
VEASTTSCRCCGKARGFIYTGPVYAVEELNDELCPWCISDGSAATQFDAGFTDVGWGVPADVPRAVLDEVAKRTPGFAGWQQEHWLYHCADAAAFLGRVGHRELREHPEALDMIRHENSGFGWSDEEVESYLSALHADGDATAYLFRCLRCDRYLAYADMS